MSGYAKATDALIERRRDIGQKILELPVVQLTLFQATLRIRNPFPKIFIFESAAHHRNTTAQLKL